MSCNRNTCTRYNRDRTYSNTQFYAGYNRTHSTQKAAHCDSSTYTVLLCKQRAQMQTNTIYIVHPPLTSRRTTVTSATHRSHAAPVPAAVHSMCRTYHNRRRRRCRRRSGRGAHLHKMQAPPGSVQMAPVPMPPAKAARWRASALVAGAARPAGLAARPAGLEARPARLTQRAAALRVACARAAARLRAALLRAGLLRAALWAARPT